MIEILKQQKDYELLDAGAGEKLERYGEYVLRRPDPEALWQKTLSKEEWDKAQFRFVRNGPHTKWETRDEVAKEWNISFGDFTFSIRPTSFKHTGLFPEQLLNWQWMEQVISQHKDSYPEPISVLNLFAYTGGATLACARAGAEVCHVDGSKTAVAWARENAELSGLKDAPIRWITDDVIAFLKREIKRGRKYDAIVMDPPSFGHGPNDELWKIEEHFLELMKLCSEVLSDAPLFVLINGYTAGYSPIAYENTLKDMMNGKEGEIEIGELTIAQSSSDKLLPCGIFARWERGVSIKL
jgi:23S rRNA (cytosine1962-C5)-methyltransferase